MAQRRMFSKAITNSSQFLMMPTSSQNLYFHLGMNADDDGFCEHFTIMRMTDSKPDDLKVLHAKGFVNVFDDRVLVITDWKENNYLRSDRYTPSKYLQIYKEELAAIASGIPVVDQMATQDRLGKVRLGKDRKGEVTNSEADASRVHDPLGAEIIKAFEQINPACKRMYGITTQRAACDDLIETYGLEQVKRVIAFLPQSNGRQYVPTITTPVQLRDKWVQLENALRRIKEETSAKNNCIIL